MERNSETCGVSMSLVVKVLLTICLTGSWSLASLEKEVSYGTAYNESGEIVYKEKHTSEFYQGKLQNLKTEYFLKESNESFGSIDSNFVKNSYVPSYKFIDNRHGRRAGIKRFDNQVLAYAKESESSIEEEKPFKLEKNTVAGQGLHNFLKVHLKEFVRDINQEKKVSFLIPMNQDVYTFRIRSKEIDKEKGFVKIRIEADSWILRWVAPHIDVTYEIISGRLIEYRGPSNLLTNDKKKMNVRIAYEYPVLKKEVASGKISSN